MHCPARVGDYDRRREMAPTARSGGREVRHELSITRTVGHVRPGWSHQKLFEFRLLPQDFLHRLSFGELIDQLV